MAAVPGHGRRPGDGLPDAPGAGLHDLADLARRAPADRPVVSAPAAEGGLGAVAQPSPAERYALVVAVLGLFRWLHALGLVVGDVSHANVLWTVRPGPAPYLLDCDGVRVVGRPPVLEQADTPDWHDPLAASGTATVDSDRYKAALVAGRVLSQDPYVTPGKPLRPLSGVLDDRRADAVRVLWEQASGARGTRPHLAQWCTALAGRDTIRLIAAEPGPKPVVDRSKFDGPRTRGRITLRN